MSLYEEDDRLEPLGEADAEERARTWWEWGREGEPPVYPGDGVYGRLVRATFGEAPKKRSARQPRQEVDWREYLPFKEVRKLYNACAYALAMDRLLNTFWTFTWKVGGVEGDAAGAKFFSDMKAALRKHCRTAGLPDEMIYVHEKGKEFGFHTHMLLHIRKQDRREMRKFVRDHITELLGGEVLKKRIRTSVGKEMKLFDHRPAPPGGLDDGIAWQWERFRYLIKGVNENERVPEVGRGLRPRHSICDVFDLRRYELKKSLHMDFDGPRAGTTHSVAGGVQERVGFVSAFERGETAGSDLYHPRWYNIYRDDKAQWELARMLETLRL